jgi:metal-responsive CopG/Arc/MetJ family transcriptional regulator
MTKKFAISVPDELFERAEQERASTRASRSGMVQEALAEWVRKREEERADDAYERAYRAMPEGLEEQEAWARAGISSWSDETWSDEDAAG